MENRNYNLDLLRFSAAIFVFFGHLLYGLDHQISSNYQNRSTSIFELGSFFVLVFFFISGVALRFQTEKYGHGRKWIFARIVRLIPIYWVTLIVSLLGAVYFGARIDYPIYGYALTFIGVESLIPSISIPPGNPPLWSLSVEMILSVSVLLFGHPKVLRKKLLFISSIFILVLWFPNHVVLVGCLFFYSGYLFARVKVQRIFWSKVILLFFVISLLIITFFSQEYFSISSEVCEILFSYLLVTSLTFPLLMFKSITPGIMTKVSERSYSLYAVHFPVITAVESLWYQGVDNLTINQLLLTVLLVIVSTELAFQLIERPSIRQSRKILKRNSDLDSV